jgi:hypothetical protein
MRIFKVSKAALKRVTNPLPIPTACPYCGSPVLRVNNSLIYRREYGQWPWAYKCEDVECDSYVGMHPKTDIPLGTLANKETRAARKKAKAVFMPFWESGRMTQTEAYAWLGKQLGIENVEHCHFGWFDAATCERAYGICTAEQVIA